MTGQEKLGQGEPMPPRISQERPNGEVPVENVEITTPAGLMERVIEGTVGKALSHADVRTVFGDPVTRDNRTVIPVARVTANYGFGAGGGTGQQSSERPGESGGGGGGGGRIKANAVGYIEMTPDSAKFVPIVDRTTMLTTLAAVFGVTMMLTLPGLLRTWQSNQGKQRRRGR